MSGTITPAVPTRLSRLAPVIVVVAVLAAYWNAFTGPFVFDDPSSIVANPTLRRLWPPKQALSPPNVSITVQGRPVLNFSLAVDYAISGTATWSYHATNIAIHTIAALALFGLIRRTLWRRWPESEGALAVALATAVLWAVHPLQTESIDYVVQRAESQMGMFFLLTFCAFARGADSPRPARWQGLAIALCALGAATKEVMVTAPPLLLLYDCVFVSGSFRAAWRRHRWVHAGCFATWLIVAALVIGTGGNRGGSVGFGVGIAWWAYPLTQFQAICRYLLLSLWPYPLVFEYGTYWVNGVADVLPWLLPVVILIGATWWALVRRPALGFLGAWFLVILAPTSLAPGTTQMMVEHRMYLPLAPVMLLLVLVLRRWLRAGMGAATLAIAVVFTMVTLWRNTIYRSETALWADTVAHRPNNPLAHQMLAMALEQAGDRDRAIEHYEAAVRLKPNFALAHDTLGELLYRAGRRAEAAAHFATALELQPKFADAHDHMAVVLADAHREREALGHAEAAVQLRPDYPEAQFHLANILADLERGADAIPHYEKALQLKPHFPAAHYNLGNALAMSGRVAEAVPHYEAAVRQKPDYVEAYNNLGSALMDLGRTSEAIARFEQTLKLDPRFTDAATNLARAKAIAAGTRAR